MERRLLYKLRVGSHLYGLNRPESDEDYMGVFMPTADDLLGLKKVEEVDNSTKSSSEERRNTAGDVDDKSYSLHKFMHLLLQNNPNIVEVLFATPENILVDSPEFQELRENTGKLLSQRVFHTFTGYAFSQRKKLTVKSERYHSLVSGVKALEMMFGTELLNDRRVALDNSTAEKLNKTLKYYKGQKGNTESFHKGMSIKMIYDKLVEERDNYGWRVKTDTFDELGYDVKFGYHLIRILAEGAQLLATGELAYPIQGEAREEIVKVREGKVELEQLLEMYDYWDHKCKQAMESTPLAKKPDFNWTHDWTVNATINSLIRGA